MTDRQMFDKTQELRIKIEGHLVHKYSMLIHKYSMVYVVSVSVGNEEKGLYFVDVEAVGSKKTYFHFRGMLTEEQIKEKFF